MPGSHNLLAAKVFKIDGKAPAAQLSPPHTVRGVHTSAQTLKTEERLLLSPPPPTLDELFIPPPPPPRGGFLAVIIVASWPLAGP